LITTQNPKAHENTMIQLSIQSGIQAFYENGYEEILKVLQQLYVQISSESNYEGNMTLEERQMALRYQMF